MSVSFTQWVAHTINALGVTIGLFAADNPVVARTICDGSWRLQRIKHRLVTLLERLEAGTLRPAPPPPSRPSSETRGPDTVGVRRRASSGKERLRLPTRHGWLVAMAPPIRDFVEDAEILVAHPKTLELLEAAPRAARLLRPLCHMMGIALPEHLRLPPRPKPSSASALVAAFVPDTETPSAPEPNAWSDPNFQQRFPRVCSARWPHLWPDRRRDRPPD